MSTALVRAVDALSDPNVGLADALRALLVVSRRIEATELSTWLRGELDGYEVGDPVPSYREGEHLPVGLRFEGPMGFSMTHTSYAPELPDVLGEAVRRTDLRAPVAELVELASGDTDATMQLPAAWVARYRTLAEEGRVASHPMAQLAHAAIKVPSTHLKGILDRIKTTALELALSIEDVSAEAGDSGGPTVTDEPRLAQ